MIRKNLRLAVMFLIMTALSVWAITTFSKGFSFAVLCRELDHANPYWLAAAVLVMPGTIVFEGLALRKLITGLQAGSCREYGIVYGAADIYFSAITPSSTGGQPASAYFMISDGIPAAKATVILLINLILYNFSTLACGIASIPLGNGVFFRMEGPAQVMILIGSGLIMCASLFFWLLLWKPGTVQAVGKFLISLGIKIRLLRHPERLEAKLVLIMHQYTACSQAAAGKNRLIFAAFWLNVMQRICQTLGTVFCYLALGGSVRQIFPVWSVQLMTCLGAYSLPLIPGGVGISDYLLISGLEIIPGADSAVSLALVSRGISFYCCVLVSAVCIFIGTFRRQHQHNS